MASVSKRIFEFYGALFQDKEQIIIFSVENIIKTEKKTFGIYA